MTFSPPVPSTTSPKPHVLAVPPRLRPRLFGTDRGRTGRRPPARIRQGMDQVTASVGGAGTDHALQPLAPNDGWGFWYMTGGYSGIGVEGMFSSLMSANTRSRTSTTLHPSKSSVEGDDRQRPAGKTPDDGTVWLTLSGWAHILFSTDREDR